MADFRRIIANELREKRPNISDSSEKTYASTLFSLNKKMGGDKDLDFFKQHKEILKFVKENMSNKQTQKTLLSALLIITGLSEYREDMLAFAKEVNDTYKTQKITDKQRAHRISFDDVKGKVEKLLVGLKQHKTMQGFEQFLAGAFSSGVYAPPRRSEFANVRINNYDRRVDNYLAKNKMLIIIVSCLSLSWLCYWLHYFLTMRSGAERLPSPGWGEISGIYIYIYTIYS